MSIVKKLAKNTSMIFTSQIINYILLFIGTIYTSRYLGPEGYGILSTGVALTTVFAVIGDLGLGTITVREVARDKSLTNKYIVNTALMKVILSIVMVILIIIAVKIINYSPEINTVIYILTLSVIFNTFSGILGSIFQAYEKMEYGAIAGIWASALTFICLMLAIYFNLNIFAFAFINVIISALSLIYMASIFVWKFFLPKMDVDLDLWKPDINVDWNFWKPVIIQALPLSIAIIFSTILFKLDTILLSIMEGTLVVGWYSVAYNILQALMFIPSAFTASVFPLLSVFHISSKESLEVTYQKSFKYLSILGIPITILITLLADKIILFIYPQGFIPSIIALKILVWVVPFTFMTITFGTILTAINKQNLLMKIVFIILIFNLILNLILIPQFSYVGSAVATVISELITFIIYFHYISKFICRIKFTDTLIKIIIASGIMGLFIIYASMNLFLVILLAAIIYFVSLILLNTFSKEELNLFKQMLGVIK